MTVTDAKCIPSKVFSIRAWIDVTSTVDSVYQDRWGKLPPPTGRYALVLRKLRNCVGCFRNTLCIFLQEKFRILFPRPVLIGIRKNLLILFVFRMYSRRIVKLADFQCKLNVRVGILYIAIIHNIAILCRGNYTLDYPVIRTRKNLPLLNYVVLWYRVHLKHRTIAQVLKIL